MSTCPWFTTTWPPSDRCVGCLPPPPLHAAPTTNRAASTARTETSTSRAYCGSRRECRQGTPRAVPRGDIEPSIDDDRRRESGATQRGLPQAPAGSGVEREDAPT